MSLRGTAPSGRTRVVGAQDEGGGAVATMEPPSELDTKPTKRSGAKKEKAAEPDPAKKKAFLDTFLRAAAALVQRARSEREDTTTTLWKRQYKAHREQRDEGWRKIRSVLETLAKKAGDSGLTSMDEKEFPLLKKQSEQLRAELLLFEHRHLAPVKQIVNEYQHLLDKARREAEEKEKSLFTQTDFAGISGELEKAISELNGISFDEATGEIVIHGRPLPL